MIRKGVSGKQKNASQHKHEGNLEKEKKILMRKTGDKKETGRTIWEL